MDHRAHKAVKTARVARNRNCWRPKPVKTNKVRSTLVPKVPKIAARWRQIEFCIYCAKIRQIERSSVVCSLNVNKLSREFFHDFFGEKYRQNERNSAFCSLNVNKV